MFSRSIPIPVNCLPSATLQGTGMIMHFIVVCEGVVQRILVELVRHIEFALEGGPLSEHHGCLVVCTILEILWDLL